MLVRKKYKNLFFSIVLALVGNKDDMYQFEEVSDDEGRLFAKELNAIYKRTSAKNQTGGGIDDLFKIIGVKFLHPDSENTSVLTKEEKRTKKIKLQRDKIKNDQKKRLLLRYFNNDYIIFSGYEKVNHQYIYIYILDYKIINIQI